MYKSFIAGIGIGIGLGILFAPMSGEETRNNLRERTNDLTGQAKDVLEQGRERINQGWSSIRGGAQGPAQAAGEEAGFQSTGTQGV